MDLDTSTALALLGTSASVFGLVIAGIQSIRMRELRRRTNADVWLSIRATRSMIRKLEPAEVRNQNRHVAEVYGKLTELFCHLLKQAILDEKNFTEDTIHRWRKADKLDSNWQEAQARQFLSTSAIRSSKEQERAPETASKKIGTPPNQNPAADGQGRR